MNQYPLGVHKRRTVPAACVLCGVYRKGLAPLQVPAACPLVCADLQTLLQNVSFTNSTQYKIFSILLIGLLETTLAL